MRRYMTPAEIEKWARIRCGGLSAYFWRIGGGFQSVFVISTVFFLGGVFLFKDWGFALGAIAAIVGAFWTTNKVWRENEERYKRTLDLPALFGPDGTKLQQPMSRPGSGTS
jgi:hypothetical protein